MPMSERTDLPQWRNLQGLAAEVGGRHVRDLFAEEPGRHSALSLETLDLLYDFSRQRVTTAVVTELCALASACALGRSVRCLRMAPTSCRQSAPSWARSATSPRGCRKGGSPGSRARVSPT